MRLWPLLQFQPAGRILVCTNACIFWYDHFALSAASSKMRMWLSNR